MLDLRNEEVHKRLKALCQYPQETSHSEYKAAVEFKEGTEFAAKIVKQVIGHANAGGGTIVVGFRQGVGGVLEHDPQLADEITKSFETTRLSQCVDSFLTSDDRISLRVCKVPHGGQNIPVVVVDGFVRHPHFCGKDFRIAKGKPILEEGALYLRLPSAKTVKVTTPTEWNELINVCVEHRHEEFLHSLGDLMQRAGLAFSSGTSQPSASKADPSVGEWLARVKARANSEFQKLKESTQSSGLFELIHRPINNQGGWDQETLLQAMKRAECRNTGWPIGVVLLNNPSAKPRVEEDGIWSCIATPSLAGRLSFDFWATHSSGTFFLWRGLEEDWRMTPNTTIFFDTRVWRVAEGLLHASNLYRSLGLAGTERISVEINLFGLSDRALSASNSDRAFRNLEHPKISVNTFKWSTTSSLDEIVAGLDSLILDHMKRFLLLFDFLQLEDSVIRGVVQEFLKSRN